MCHSIFVLKQPNFGNYTMTMHLMSPAYNSCNTKKTKSKFTKTRLAQLQKEWREHNKWLKQRHLDKITFEQYLDQCVGTGGFTDSEARIKQGKSHKMKTYIPAPSYAQSRIRENQQYRSVDMKQGVAGNRSIMDPHNLNKESPETREAILNKSKRIAVAYNKGGYQYVTDGADLASLGRKNVQ